MPRCDKLAYMSKSDEPVKFMAKLPPDLHHWLKVAAAERSDLSVNMNDLLVQALRYYQTQPAGALDDSGLRVCCGTSPEGGHRGTCRYSLMRGGSGK